MKGEGIFMNKHIVQKSAAVLFTMSLCVLAAGCQASDNNSASSASQTINSESSPTKASADPTTQPTQQTEPTLQADPTLQAEPTLQTKATATPALEPANEPSTDYHDYESLAALLAPYHIRFGTVINGMTVNSKAFQSLVTSQFNSITAANEMKAYSLLDQKACQQAKDGMPVMNYYMADQIMDYAKTNQIAVRGHNLVWDAYMCDWFFREGYLNDGEYVDSDTMKQRLRYYITEVITHFETNYPGVIYCWDVVNEAVGDSETEYDTADERHVRTARSGGPNCFLEHVGTDYVELSFLYAKDALDACNSDVKLFYNDYNAFHENKCNAICELVKSINSYALNSDKSARILCDGVGMQGYIGGYGVQEGCLDPKDITKIETAIRTYAALGVEVQLTEMAVRNFDASEEMIEKHAQFYQDLFAMFLSINKGEDCPLTAITIWGITDDLTSSPDSYTYRLNSPYGGLFTQNYKVKKAFYNIYELIKKD